MSNIIKYDDDKAFRGEVEAYLRERRVLDTHTGGYNPNSNAQSEVRIGMLKQLFRVVLLCATGGHLYYDQLWDVGMVYCNTIINYRKWTDRESPISQLRGEEVALPDKMHVFGAYCLYTVPKELRGGTFRPKSEMGIWVGLAPHTHSHWVCPIEWDSVAQAWIVHDVVIATTVSVYDHVLPLRMKAPQGKAGTQELDRFVSAVFNPLVPAQQESKGKRRGRRGGSGARKHLEPHTPGESPYVEGESCEVEKVLDKRTKGGVAQYKIKWSGWDNRYNCWKDVADLDCPGLVSEYESEHAGMSREDALMVASCMCLCLAAVGSIDQQVLPGLELDRALRYLSRRQGLSGEGLDFVQGYNTELLHMMGRRLDLCEQERAEQILSEYPVVPLRMILEAKKDGRKKCRLVLQGFREPIEWDVDSNASPVAYMSTIRSLIYMAGDPSDVLSSIDVSVAFLQADEYEEGSAPRYVSYTPYPGGPKYVFRLRGPIYGQRSAPRAWYKTVSAWMVDEMRYDQGKDAPCVFYNPVTRHRVVLFCDDFLCRGSRAVSEQFYESLHARFDCKEPSYLESGGELMFCGLNVSMRKEAGYECYTIDQSRDIQEFLIESGLDGERHRVCPTSDKSTLANSDPISEEKRKWCRSAIGSMHHLARGTRWDISQAVNRVSQTMQDPTQGTVDAIKSVAGYLAATAENIYIKGRVNPDKDRVVSMCDSNHHGDRKITSRSQSGVIILLNGAPVMWRSNAQPRTTNSPVESEVYALSVGCKDTRLMGWVLEELRVCVQWPMKICCDSTGAASFKKDTCPISRLRGCFSYRWDWVEELRKDKHVEVVGVSDQNNLADIFTKCLKSAEHTARVRQILEALK